MVARKPKGEKKRAEMLKPGTRSLFEAIESFLQLIDMIRVPGINVPKRLFHITFSMRVPLRNAFFTSSWRRGHLLVTAR